jgi:hypothetical protein
MNDFFANGGSIPLRMDERYFEGNPIANDTATQNCLTA